MSGFLLKWVAIPVGLGFLTYWLLKKKKKDVSDEAYQAAEEGAERVPWWKPLVPIAVSMLENYLKQQNGNGHWAENMAAEQRDDRSAKY